MIFLGSFKAGTSVKYRANFHTDQGTLEDPTSPEAQHESPAGVFTSLTAPAKLNSKTGHYGGAIDTTGFAAGQHIVRMAGTVSTAKTTATEFCFEIVAYDPADAAALGLSRLDAAVSSRASQTSVDTIDDFLDTEVAAIKAKTDNLPASPANETTVAAVNTKLGTPAGATVSADVAAVKSDSAAIKIKTDQLTFTLPNKVDVVAEIDAVSVGEAVWENDERTLTQAAAQVAAIVAGSQLSLLRGDRLVIALTGLGSLASRTKLWFTMKRDATAADADALVQITEAGGLLVLNGVGSGTAPLPQTSWGTLTVDDATEGNITIVLTAAASAQLESGRAAYDVQMLTAAGVSTKTQGVATVSKDITRAVS